MKKILFVCVLCIFQLKVIGQFALSFSESYIQNQKFEMGGFQSQVGLSYTTKQKFYIEIGGYTAFLKGDRIEKDIKETANYWSIDDFPENFPANINKRTLSSSPFSDVYSSMKKDVGIEVFIGKKVELWSKFSFNIAGIFGSRRVSLHKLVENKTYRVIPYVIDPVFNSDEPVDIIYPRHLFLGYSDNYTGINISIVYRIKKGLQIGTNFKYLYSFNSAGPDYLAGLKIIKTIL